MVYTDASGSSFVFREQEGLFGSPRGLEAIMCQAGSRPPCPSALPTGVTYEVMYLKTPLVIAFEGKTGFNYPIYIEFGTEKANAHYTTGLKLPTSWTDSASHVIEYAESATEGYSKATETAQGETLIYKERANTPGTSKLVEVLNAHLETTMYVYGSGAEEGLLTKITEPDGSMVDLSYNEANQVTSAEPIASGQTSGPTTTYTYYELGHAPSPCTSAQKAVAVTTPERGGLYCSNVLDEVEKVHELKPPAFTGFEFSTYDESASSPTVLYFSGAEDPPLPEGSPGPEVATYSYRYSVNGGPFTAWAQIDPIEVEVPHIQPGATVAIEVYATDTEGNVSSVVTASTVVPEIGLGIEAEAPGETGEVDMIEQPEAKSEEEDPGPYTETPCAGTGPCGQYKWWAAKAYAERWAHSHNEEYSYFEPEGADCANFVSQALHAGGLRFMRANGHNSPNVTEGGLEGLGFHKGPGAWWSAYTEDLETFPPNRVHLTPTIAWDNAGRLYEHLLNFGLIRVLKSHVAEPPRPGDLVFYDEKGTALTGSTIGHVQIVVKTENGMTFVQQHTKPYPQARTLGYIIRKVNGEKGALGEKWAYVIVRPIHTAANLYK